MLENFWKNYPKQECIPVGCVLAARRPYSEVCFPGGVCLVPGGGLPAGGVCLVPGGWSPSHRGGSPSRGGGVCLVPRGGWWSPSHRGGSPSRGGLPGPGGGGLPATGGVLPAGGWGLPGPKGGWWSPSHRGGSPSRGGWGLPGPKGGVVSQPGGVSLPGEPPPVDRITDTCKNITLATTSLRPVKTDTESSQSLIQKFD